MNLHDELERARTGDRSALARLISVSERASGVADLEAFLDHGEQSFRVGVTGPPGAGKSTLLSALLEAALAEDQRIAVLAVDPSSPLTGGAILGDRVRMQAAARDPRVFIRSMATRRKAGGLSAATRQVSRVLGNCGWPWIVIETVGIGQIELDVASAADTVVVVLNPGAGDEIQASKAGLMEIADLFVINKADQPGTRQLRRDIEAVTASRDGWRPPVIETIATDGAGVSELWSQIKAHRAHLEGNGLLVRHRRNRLRGELVSLIAHRMQQRLDALGTDDALDTILSEIEAGRTDLGSAARQIAVQLGLA